MNKLPQRLKELSGAFALFLGCWLIIGWMDWSFSCKPMPTAWPNGRYCEVLKFLYDWQSIIAGLFAIVAALIGGMFIRRQIELSDQHEKERLRRKHAAARAMLPLALSSLSEYARECAQLLRNIHIQSQGEAVPLSALQNLKLPALPMDTTNDLRSMVEASGPTEGRAIATTLSNVQVLASRLSSLHIKSNTQVVVLANIEDYIINAAEIQARADELFDYARGETEDVPASDPSVDSLRRAIFILRFHETRFDRIRETITRRGARR